MGNCFSFDNSNELCIRLPPIVDEVLQAKQDAELNLVESRIVTSSVTENLCLYTERGLKGLNQDAMIIWENFLGDPDLTLAAVIDGHGPFGHIVAQRVRDSLPSRIMDTWKDASNKEERKVLEVKEEKCKDVQREEENRTEGIPVGAENSQNLGSLRQNEEGTAIAVSNVVENENLVKKWTEVLTKAFAEMDKEVCGHSKIEPEASGAAVVLAVKQGNLLVIANLGDCRAVLASSQSDGDFLEPVQLTEDHKCSEPRERERIRSAKGRVFALDDEPHVMRVWLPTQMRPGLAMSRAFGDLILKNYGVTCVPEVSFRWLTEADKFLVLASDGVWDVTTNEDATRIVTRTPRSGHAAKILIETAKVEWSAQFPHSRRDDCTAAVLYLSADFQPEISPIAIEELRTSSGSSTAEELRENVGETLTSTEGAEEQLKVQSLAVPVPLAKASNQTKGSSVFTSIDSEDSTSDLGSSGRGPDVVIELPQGGLRFFRNDTIGNLPQISMDQKPQ